MFPHGMEKLNSDCYTLRNRGKFVPNLLSMTMIITYFIRCPLQLFHTNKWLHFHLFPYFRWLQPESFVDPKQCEIIFNKEDIRCSMPTVVTVLSRDQYGGLVAVPNLKVNDLVKHRQLYKYHLTCWLSYTLYMCVVAKRWHTLTSSELLTYNLMK